MGSRRDAGSAQFRILGPLEVLDSEARLIRLPGSKTKALLAELVINANHVVSTDRLIEALWGESPPETAAKTLQTYVVQLRKAVEPSRKPGTSGELVLTRESGYVLAVHPDQIDAVRFQNLIREGREALRESEPQRAAEVISEALALWRGPPLADVGTTSSAQPEAVRLEELRLAALEDLTDAHLAVGRHSEVVADIEAFVAAHPLRERFWAQLMLALYRAGRQGDALRAFQRARAAMVEELGIEPGPALRRMEAAVLAQDPALDLDLAPVAPDLPLPLRVTDGAFVGRRQELAELLSAWDATTAGDGRLTLIVGPAGIGKTRLAAELARRAHGGGGLVLYGRAMERTSRFHPFAEALEGIGSSIAGVLGAAEDPTPAHFAAALIAFLRRRAAARPVLVVLDDLDRADEESLTAVSELREASAGTRILVVGTIAESALVPEALADAKRANVVRLGPLSQEDVASIAAQYLGPRAGESVASLLASARGAPLFVHREAARMARSLAARRIGEATDRAVEAQSDLHAVQRQIVGDVLELQRLLGEPAPSGAPRSRADGDATSPRPTINCPYKGLAPFEVSDAAFFFGRERLVAELVARLVGSSFVALVGPSGSGKSSLARAGLLPALRDGFLPGADRWAQLVMSPGTHPARQLVRRLTGTEGPCPTGESVTAAIDSACSAMPAGGGLLIFVDQFEEVFTACHDPSERRAFLDALVQSCKRTERAVTVVVTVRSDCYGAFASHAALAELLAANHVLVGLMSAEELRRAIELPAQRAGLGVEPVLIEAVISDIGDEPGGLPLLSTALMEAWEHRVESTLRLSGYERRGRLHGAVARLAEAAYADLAPDQRELARRLLLRLADWDQSGRAVRRQMSIGQLASDDPEATAVLSALTDRRLLTSHDGMVEVAHEALLREWPRLRSWLDDDLQGRRLHGHLRNAAEEWEHRGRDDSDLYGGGRLVAASEWATNRSDELDELERAFLERSRAKVDHEAAEARRRERHQLATNRRLRTLVAGLVLVLVVALLAGGQAISQRRRAGHQALLAEARRVAAQSVVESDFDRSLLLAREASDLDDSADTRSSLLANLVRSPQAVGVLRAGGDRLLWDTDTRRRLDPPLSVSDPQTTGVVFSPDGRTLLASTGIRGDTNGAVVFWDVASRTPTGERLRGFPLYAGRIALSDDARTLAASGPGALMVWDMAAPERSSFTLASGRHGQSLFVAVSGDGRVVATSYPDGTAQIWDVPTRTLIRQFDGVPGAVAMSPGGTIVAVSATNGTISLYDVASGERRQSLSGHTDQVWDLEYSRDGTSLISASDDRNAIVWDVASGSRRETLRGHSGRVLGATFSPDGNRIYTAGLDGTAMIWELAGSGRMREQLAPATGAGPPSNSPLSHVPSQAVSPNGRLVATSLYDGTATLREIHGGDRIGRPLSGNSRAAINRMAFSPDGSLLAAAHEDGTATVWNVLTQDVVSRLEGGHQAAVYTVAWSPDGRLIATGGADGVVMIWDQATARVSGAMLAVRRPSGPFEPEPGGPWGQLLPRSHPGLVNEIAFSRDGRWLAAAIATPERGEVIVWRMPSRSLRYRLPADNLRALTVSISPNSRTLASAGREGKVRMWDLTTGRPLSGPLDGHAGVVHSSAFSPDGSMLATAGSDASPLLWDVRSQKRLGAPLPGPPEAGNARVAAAFNPDGRRLVAVYQDGQAWQWDTDPGSWRFRACSVAGRNLSQTEWQSFLPGRAYRRICENWPSGS
jgi:WD40 repeat protein/DNA-binding SARP family transcriptional activator